MSKSRADYSDILPQWKDFESFEEAMRFLGWTPGYSISRIDDNAPLEPGNVQFCPNQNINRSRKNTKYVFAFGVMAPLAWFIESHPMCNVRDYHVVYGRIASGWSPQDAMIKPSAGRAKPPHCTYSPNKMVEYNGVKKRLSDIISDNTVGLTAKDLVKRLNLGWSLDQAMSTPHNGARPKRR